MTPVTRELARYCATTKYEELSAAAVEAVKRLAWDFLAVTLRGAEAPSSLPVLRFVEDLGLPGPSTVLGRGTKAQPQYAALANGTSVKGYELDDISTEASSHIGPVVFPVALALAEAVPTDGRTFVTAVAMGYEAMVRIGRAVAPREHYAHGFHPSGTCGVFGAATTAARLCGLDVERTVHALGIAGSQAAGLQEFLFEGAWTKALHSGWAAHSGILAARLARQGFRAPTTILEGRFGFLRSYSHAADPDLVLDGLGRGFKVTEVGIKRYSACRYEHGAIDAILELVREHRLLPADIRQVEIRLVRAAFPIIAEPVDVKYRPQTPMDAMHSMPYGAAVAIVRGSASVEDHAPEVIAAPEVRDLIARVRCVHDPELEREFPVRWPTVVRIETVTGRWLERRKDHPHGDAADPLSWEEIRAKVEHLTAGRLPGKVGRELEDMLRRLDSLSDVGRLGALLGTATVSP